MRERDRADYQQEHQDAILFLLFDKIDESVRVVDYSCMDGPTIEAVFGML